MGVSALEESFTACTAQPFLSLHTFCGTPRSKTGPGRASHRDLACVFVLCEDEVKCDINFLVPSEASVVSQQYLHTYQHATICSACFSGWQQQNLTCIGVGFDSFKKDSPPLPRTYVFYFIL